jgi:hypothetical protein
MTHDTIDGNVVQEKADLFVQNEGSIFLLRPVSEAGEQWIYDNIPDDAQRFGDAIVVEHRYIRNIVAGAQADGLKVE